MLYNEADLLALPPEATLQIAEHTGLLVARKNLRIGIRKLYNSAGSLIRSEGSLFIGGRLSPEGEIHGLAIQVRNCFAILEAQNHLRIQSYKLGNENAYFVTQRKCLRTEERLEYQPEGEENRYPQQETRWDLDEKDYKSLYLLKEKDRKVRCFTEYNYTRSRGKTVVIHSYPSRIQSGQGMQLSGDIVNERSEILAGGNLSEVAGLPYRLDTQGVLAERIDYDKGYSQKSYVKWPSGWYEWWGLPKERYYHPKEPYQRIETHEFALPIVSTYGISPCTNTEVASSMRNDAIDFDKLPLSHIPDFSWLPTHGLYSFQTGPQHPYLLEIDAQFLRLQSSTPRRVLSSDYLLRDKLQLATLPKRLGSGHYEQQQVKEQIRLLTQQRYLPGQSNDEATFRKLMDAGYEQSKELRLAVGIPLTPNQVNQLKQDMLWMVNREVTPPNAPSHTVLVPQVYVTRHTRQPTVRGALLSAKNIALKAEVLNNIGSTLLSQEGIQIEADSINNQEAHLSTQGNLQLKVEQCFDSTDDQIAAQGSLSLEANDLAVTGGHMLTPGTLQVEATGGIEFKTGQHQANLAVNVDETESHSLSSEARKKQQAQTTQVALPTCLQAAHVQLKTAGDFHATGLQLSGQASVQIDAGGALHCEAAENTLNLRQHESTSQSGLLNEGILTVGKQEQTCHKSQEQVFHTGTAIHTQGTLTLNAGQALHLAGSDLEANERMQLSGSTVEITEVMSTEKSEARQRQNQAGLSLGVGGGIAAIGGQIKQELEEANQAQSSSLTLAKNLQAAYTAGSVMSSQLSRNQGVASTALVNGLGKGSPSEALQASGVAAQASLGVQSQSQASHQTTGRAQLSQLKASKIQIQARETDLKLSGSEIKAENLELAAARDVTVQQASDMAESSQESRHEQIKVGMSAGMYGAQAFAEVQGGPQQRSTSSTTDQASILQARQRLHIQSGGDTRLAGVQASGKRVTAQIAGELSLKSTPDTTQEKANSTGYYTRVGIPTGPVGIASLDFSHQTQQMGAESASVQERTMLTAGQDGFDIQVGKATQLIGGGIQSEAPLDQNQWTTETIQATQVHNQANYEQSKTGAQLHSGANPAEMLVRHATSHVSCLTNRPRVKSGVTAGFFSGVQPTLNSKEAAAPPSPEPVHHPIAAFDTVEMAEQSILGETVSQLGMQISGDVMGVVKQKMPAGLGTEVLRTGLHAGVAGMSATLSDHSVSGAMAGAAAGNLVTHAWGRTKATSEWDKAVSELTQNAVSGIAGAAAGILFDGQDGAYSGAAQAILADQWNRQLHKEESEELDAFIQVSASEEQQRLKEAAVYLTQGSARVPHNDPQRAALEDMEAKGKTHTAELELLSETGLFKYTDWDSIKDWAAQHGGEGFDRSLGAFQASYGMVGVGAGKVLFFTAHPLLKAVGAWIGAVSAGEMTKGIKCALGPYESKEGERAFSRLGFSHLSRRAK